MEKKAHLEWEWDWVEKREAFSLSCALFPSFG